MQLRRLALRSANFALDGFYGGIQLTGLGSGDHRIQDGNKLGPVTHGNRPLVGHQGDGPVPIFTGLQQGAICTYPEHQTLRKNPRLGNAWGIQIRWV